MAGISHNISLANLVHAGFEFSVCHRRKKKKRVDQAIPHQAPQLSSCVCCCYGEVLGIGRRAQRDILKNLKQSMANSSRKQAACCNEGQASSCVLLHGCEAIHKETALFNGCLPYISVEHNIFGAKWCVSPPQANLNLWERQRNMHPTSHAFRAYIGTQEWPNWVRPEAHSVQNPALDNSLLQSLHRKG